ncbi:MAG: hypothetical protein KatS3mg102_1142 [Planctomycetota bacterium]|nr:MAG: hypothetical protein KatS3mg102_1142 [Planctomycetota bacterium]
MRPSWPSADSPPSDAALVERARAGDREAFGALVARYDKVVGLLCLQKLGRRADADDATQETFLKAFAALEELSEPARFGPWLYHIAFRVAIDHLRRRRRRRRAGLRSLEQLCASGSELEPVAGAGAAEAAAVRREQAEQIMAAIGMLPDKYRLALTLRYYEHMSYREIARAPGRARGHGRQPAAPRTHAAACGLAPESAVGRRGRGTDDGCARGRLPAGAAAGEVAAGRTRPPPPPPGWPATCRGARRAGSARANSRVWSGRWIGAFAAAAGTLPDQDGRVLARLERLGVRRRPRRRAPMWLAVLYAAAGLLLLGGYLGYATVLRLQLRAELERGTRQQVRALGTVLGLYAERTGALPAGGNRELVTALLAPRDGTPSSPRPFFCPPAERLRGGAADRRVRPAAGLPRRRAFGAALLGRSQRARRGWRRRRSGAGAAVAPVGQRPATGWAISPPASATGRFTLPSRTGTARDRAAGQPPRGRPAPARWQACRPRGGKTARWTSAAAPSRARSARPARPAAGAAWPAPGHSDAA